MIAGNMDPPRAGLGGATAVLVLAVIAALVLFLDLGSHGILNGNESLYLESAREMLLSGAVAVPTLNDLPYIEKPPLFVWLIAVASKLFGLDEASARAVSSLSTFILLLVMLRLAALLRIGRPAAAGYALATSLGVVIMSRVAMPDMLLTSLFAASSFMLLAAIVERRRSLLRGAALCLGLATLVKGLLPVVLLVGIAGGFLLWHAEGRARTLRFLADPLAMMLTFAPLFAWVALADWQLPGAASRFIVDEHILRFLGRRQPQDYYSGSPLYYVPRLFVFFFPWAGVLFFGWLAARRQAAPERAAVRRFLWLCVWLPFAFFSVSSAKANYYVILCIPAMALLTAEYLPALLRSRSPARLVLAILIPVLVAIGLMALRIWLVATGQTARLVDGPPDGSGMLTIAAICVLAIAPAVAVHLGRRRVALILVGALCAPIYLQLDHLWQRAEANVSARGMAQRIATDFPGARILLFQDFEAYGSLPYYLGRSVGVVDSRSADLWWGKQRQPRHPNLLTVAQALASPEGTLLVVRKDRQEDFVASGLAAKASELTTIGNASLYRLEAGEYRQ